MILPREWTARSLALHVLHETRRKEAFIQELLEEGFRRHPLGHADRRLTTQLVSGVVRHRGSLDVLLRQVVTRKPFQVEPLLWDALRLGAYQLTYLSRIPAYSALHETVELAAVFGVPRAKGFLNANLRALTRLLTDEVVSEPGAAALPLAPGSYRRLAQASLPDPGQVPVEYLSASFSLPSWLTERWFARFGWEETVRLSFWFLEPGPLWLRVNRLRGERDEYLARLRDAGIAAEPGQHPQAVRLVEGAAVRELPGYAEGHFVVQDQSAMKVVSALNPQPGWRVLDLCAAPGGKTTHIAELMQDRGEIIACDRDPRRLEPLRSTIERMGLTSIVPQVIEENDAPPAGPFDAVLVDVPCSNTGVLGRRPEVRWRLTAQEIERLVVLQSNLLQRAIERVAPGGVVVYSTCSIEPEENADLVRRVVEQASDVFLEEDERSSPGAPADGGYWARLRKKP